MEQWEIWVPDIEIPKFMYSKGSYITERNLILKFEDEDDAKKIVVTFDGYLSSRETYEGCFDKTWSNIYSFFDEKKLKMSRFLKVQNSEYVHWFKEKNPEYEDTIIEHYIIIAYDVISEVVSTVAPKIEVLK